MQGACRYTKLYAACNADAAPGAESMVDVYRRVAPQLRTTLVFNGDTDPCVSYEGTREAVASVFPDSGDGPPSLLLAVLDFMKIHSVFLGKFP